MPERYGSWKTVYERHRRWSADGTWDRLLQAVQAHADLAGRIDWGMVGVDSTSCRAHQHAAGARKATPRIPKKGTTPRHHRPDEGLGRSRGGLTRKIHLAGEGGCRPMALLITPGQWGDAPQMIEVLDRIRVPARWADGPGPGPTTSAATRHTALAETAATCDDATSNTPSRNRRTNAPTVDARAARAEDQLASTLTATGAATRSSGPSTASRTPVLSQPVTTSEPMSSTAPSPRQQSASGSSRELSAPGSQNPGAGMKLGHHGGTPLGHGGVAAPSQKIEMTHQTTPRSVTARQRHGGGDGSREGRPPRPRPAAGPSRGTG